MQDATTVLSIIRNRGERGLPLKNLYRQLYNPQFYFRAYVRLYSNDGAMTPDTTGETVDGMSREKIKTMIDLIRQERWRWTPVKRVYIPKKSGKLRPLGLPSWSSKVMQEVVRQLLEAYFEPTFSDRSHGFRKGARVSYCLERNCVWVEGCPLGHRRRHFRLFWTTRS